MKMIAMILGIIYFSSTLTEAKTICGMVSKQSLKRKDSDEIVNIYVIKHRVKMRKIKYYFDPMKPMCDCPESKFINEIENSVKDAFENHKKVCIEGVIVRKTNADFGLNSYYEGISSKAFQITNVKMPAQN